MIPVLLYTPSVVLSAGLQAVLDPEFSLDTVSTVADLPARAAGVVLLDFTPDVTYELLGRLKETGAALALWSSGVTPEVAFQCLHNGVRGILRKTLSAESVNQALRMIANGELWFEKSLTDKMLSQERIRLTRREAQLVSCVARGLKNKEIAFELGISEGTVKVYLSKLFPKCGAKDRLELALFGLANSTAAGPESRGVSTLVIDKAA
jgi:DNA-binding NarL/FixJ family response regulator